MLGRVQISAFVVAFWFPVAGDRQSPRGTVGPSPDPCPGMCSPAGPTPSQDSCQNLAEGAWESDLLAGKLCVCWTVNAG